MKKQLYLKKFKKVWDKVKLKLSKNLPKKEFLDLERNANEGLSEFKEKKKSKKFKRFL